MLVTALGLPSPHPILPTCRVVYHAQSNPSPLLLLVDPPCTPPPSPPQANPFSLPLAEALRDCGAHGSLMQATFDSAIFVLRRHLVTAFCEELKAVVAAYREGMRQDTAGGPQL